VPTLKFSAVVTAEEEEWALKTGTLIRPRVGGGTPVLRITSGVQEGTEIPVMKEEMTFGRATSTAMWDVILQDQAVSRPHARLHLKDGVWHLSDLGSANGTQVNGHLIQAPTALQDGCVIVMGETTLLFRLTD
jgi:pSer/pThr/pTyr-binding forkhead associated (FHA) protein